MCPIIWVKRVDDQLTNSRAFFTLIMKRIFLLCSLDMSCFISHIVVKFLICGRPEVYVPFRMHSRCSRGKSLCVEVDNVFES